MSADALSFFNAIQRGVRLDAGKALPPLLKRWRYTRSSDFGELKLPVGVDRFLTRYGILDSGSDEAERLKGYRDLLLRVSRASGDAPGVAAGWLELFADGH